MILDAEKILIIDDEPENIYVLQDRLETEGFSVIYADNGPAGIMRAENELPDLIICDIMMPTMNGFEVMKALMSNPKTDAIPFIFLSAKSNFSEIREGMQFGADDYLTKPFDSQELIHAIRTRISKKKAVDKKMEYLRKSISYLLPHELQTPLTSILGFTDILLEDYQNIDKESLREISLNIKESAARLNELIQKILLSTRYDFISQEKRTIESLRNNTIQNTKQIINEAAYKIAKAYNRERDLVLEIENSDIRITNDNFEKLLSELVDNAFKFSQKGSKVNIKGFSINGKYHISIKDKGIGMSEAEIAHIGEYIQFNRVLFERKGSGLGLSIVKKIIDIHDGVLKIESQPYQQTIVKVTLPK